MWLRVDHSPRTTWAIGDRHIAAVSQTVITGRLDHVITERWAVGVLAQYDYEHGQMLDDELVLRRAVHEFVLEMYFRYDKGRDETSAGVSFYPIGTLAPRRSY